MPSPDFEISDRKQRAREASIHALNDPTKYTPTVAKAVDAAVETATRVQIDGASTRAAMVAYADMTGYDMPSAAGMDAALRAAFTSAGFEVTDATA